MGGGQKHKRAIHKISNIHNDKHKKNVQTQPEVTKCKLNQNTVIFRNQIGREWRDLA